MAGLREVIQSHAVSNLLDREIQIHPRLDETYRGLEWRLSRRPDQGYNLPGTSYWVMMSNGNYDARIPTIVVLYVFDQHAVEVLRMLIKVVGLPI